MTENKELRFECIHCGNCCTDKNTLVNVTYEDILQIKNGLGLSLDELIEILGFFVFDKHPSKEELKKMVVPPLETEKGLAFIGLKKKTSGICYFYSPQMKKCSIYKIRPMFCRTFPFSFRLRFNVDKDNPNRAKMELYYTDKGKEYCPGIGSDAPLIKDDEWMPLGKKTIEGMNNNNILIDKWNEASRKKKIPATVRNFLTTVMNLEEKT